MLPKISFNILRNPVWVIAKNTFRESIRDRLLYGVLLIAGLITALVFFLSTVSFDQNERILHNLGLTVIHFFAVFIAIFITANSVNRDLERRTLYILLPKPISRAQYTLGKYLGVLFLVATTLAILNGLFLLGLLFTAQAVIPALLINLAFSFMEISLLTALTQLFASFTAPLNAALYGISFFMIGHSITAVKEFMTRYGGAMIQKLIDVCYYLLPNLEKYDVRGALLYHIGLPPWQVVWTIFYWVVYTGLLLYLSTLVMRKREF